MQGTVEMLQSILVSSGVIWAAIMLFKRLLRSRLSPRAHLTLWLILVARLVVPFTLDIGVHLITVPAAVSETVPAAAVATAAQPRIPIRVEARQAGGASVPAAGRQSAAAPVSGQESAAGSAVQRQVSPAEIAVTVWIAGILAGAALSVRGCRQMRCAVRRRLVPGAETLHLLFRECMSELGIRRRVVLAVQKRLAGPALMFPNVVLMPENLAAMDREQIKMALRHELMHFVRGDHIRSAGLNLLRIVWWFSPFVWLAVREIREDIETACDADVVRQLGDGGREAYAGAVLSMFGRTETNQAVLGMAFGSARKKAERRIRGIFMKHKSRPAGRAAALLLTGVLGMACFTTACQPTPAAEAVVNQRDNVPESAMIGESATVDPQATTAPAAKYAAAERWHETIDKAENFRVIADVDVMMPDVTAYPVEKVAPRELTQELADQLIEYFVPGAEFYEMDQATTKAEWEEQILAMQEALAADEARGDQDAAAQDRAAIEELTAFYENAPDQAERRAATTEFGYIRDYSGEIMEEDGPNFINVCADGPDGTVRMIAARRGHPEDLSQFPYFMYTAASYITEQQAAANQEALGTERESAEQLEEPARSEELERLDRFEEIGNQQLPLLAANSIDLEEARRRGSELLENLGIRGVQISAADKALWAPEQRGMDAGLAGTDVLTGAQTNLKQPGAYLEFQRENGGIPCVSQQSQNGIPNRGRREYSAPFIPERGCILFDADWNVQIFSWESPTEAVEIVAPDSRLIPVTEAEQKLVEELYRNELAVSEEYLKQMGLTYDVTELRLVMGYIDAAGEPDKALAVPAWYMRAEGTPRHGGSGGIYNVQEVMVSALDGAPILMPGTAQSYNYDPEAQS